jgi:hypothetical protein
MTDRTPLPYAAISVSEPEGRAMEWKRPLWDAIKAYCSAETVSLRTSAVVAVELSVERAMRIALESSSSPVSQSGPEMERLQREHAIMANALFKLEYAASGLNQEEHEAAYEIVADLFFDKIQVERKRSRERVAAMIGETSTTKARPADQMCISCGKRQSAHGLPHCAYCKTVGSLTPVLVEDVPIPVPSQGSDSRDTEGVEEGT